MPESTCLHIQDRESGPIRVVELPWISVRIGRAAYCEVRLPDEQVPEEACRLTRRGRTWSLVPSAGSSPIVFDGRPLEGPCPLPFDVPFRMGPYCLTLRNDVAAEPDWEIYPASALALEPPSRAGHEPVLPVWADRQSAEEGPRGASRPLGGFGKPGSDPDRWRARWKAAEAHLKSRAARLESGGPRPAGTATQEVWRETDRPLSRPGPPSPPPVGTPPRPVPTANTPRIEPIWNVPRTDPSPAAPRLGPAIRPMNRAAVECPEPLATPTDERPSTSESIPTVVVATDEPPAIPNTDDATDILPEREIALIAPCQDERPAPVEVEPLREDIPEAETATAPECDSPPGTAASFVESVAVDTAGSLDALVSSPTEETFSASTRTTTRGPRRRRPRERMGPGRRIEPSRRPRPEADVPDPGDDREANREAPAEVELPSVRDILVTHRNSPGPRPAVERSRRGKHAVPTVPQEPAQWALPGWIALPPVGAFTMGVGLLCCLLSWWWALDALNASQITRRLLAADGSGRSKPLPPDVTPPGGRWVKSTAQHLANWAIYTAGAERDQPPSESEVPSLVVRALEISPLNPTARLAMAQLEGHGRDGSGRIRGLGLSRDSVSLAWSARRLMESGKKEAALRLYHRAISNAVEGGLSRSATPRFAEEENVRRYFLPAEDAVRDIVTELASLDGLEFREWSRALPNNPTVLLATARLLREHGNSEADSLLDGLLGDGRAGSEANTGDARLMAARAEALALRSRWKEAADQYRQAIETVDNDLIRRSWWFNLADIADRLNDEGQRQAAFRAVLAARSSDDISRRVGRIQRSGGAKAKAREGYGSLKAN